MAARPVNAISLCAGGGALDLAAHIAEPQLRTVCYVEREAFAAACLVARMEEQALDPAPIWDDVGTFDAAAWRGVVDLVISGDPCQPNSVAGKRRGSDDDRWLADHVVSIFDDSGADRLFRENVPGNAHGQLEYFVPALEGLGCRVAVGIFSAAEVGASHRRERLFIMADRGCGPARREQPVAVSGGRDQAEPDEGSETMADGEGGRREVGRQQEPAGEQGQPGREPDGHGDGRGQQDPAPGVADAGRERPQGIGEGRTTPRAVGRGGGTEIPLFAPGPSHFGWPAILEATPQLEPAVRRVADGMAPELDVAVPAYWFEPPSPDDYIRHAFAWRTDRLRLAGNGVVILQAAYAYRTLMALLATDRAAGEAVMTQEDRNAVVA